MRSSGRVLLLIRIDLEYDGSWGEENAIIWSGMTQLRSPYLNIYSNSKQSKLVFEYHFS